MEESRKSGQLRLVEQLWREFGGEQAPLEHECLQRLQAIGTALTSGNMNSTAHFCIRVRIITVPCEQHQASYYNILGEIKGNIISAGKNSRKGDVICIVAWLISTCCSLAFAFNKCRLGFVRSHQTCFHIVDITLFQLLNKLSYWPHALFVTKTNQHKEHE